MATVSNWMHVDFFTIDQAAALWCNNDPSQVNSYDRPPEVLAARQFLISGLIAGSITPHQQLTNYSRSLDYSDVLISRLQLERFARGKQLFPKFLFDTLAPFEAPESPFERFRKETLKTIPVVQNSQAANQGGRPPEYDWDSFMLEIIRLANKPDGLPDSQAELIRAMQLWFSANYDAEPAESSIKNRISKIYKYLTEAKSKDKNPGA